MDDGSFDEQSVCILSGIETDFGMPVPVTVVRQSNSRVSAARNAGIRMAQRIFCGGKHGNNAAVMTNPCVWGLKTGSIF